jgi:hypothetical protein
MQPPLGPPVCAALKAAAGDAAAHLKHDLAQGDAHRHFDQAGVVQLAGQGEDLGALALFGADAGEPAGARVMMVGMLAIVSTLLMTVGAPTTRGGWGRAGACAACRACPRPSGSARSLRRTQRRRRRCAHRHQTESRAQHRLAQHAAPPRGADGARCAARRWGTRRGCRGSQSCADRIGADDHAFQHAVRVIFHHGAVHISARVALVAVDDDELAGAFSWRVMFHFMPVGKPPPPRPRSPLRRIFIVSSFSG